ncbi:MAG TPA: ribosome biogenesis factor YjgA [Woeseiaceae bacterium]|nr:ribosome biogenesis factor YjgA [Woeseiaceae bacterium]
MNDAKPSKSARKRDHLALQSLGEKLIPLERGELEKLGLDEPLFEAVVRARNMRSRSALRRQRQLIGKLMRDANADSIQSSLDALGRQDGLDRDRFREAERWRDRISSEGAPAVAGFAAQTGRPAAGLEMLLRELEAAGGEAGRRNVRRRIFREVYWELGELAALQESGHQ